MEIDSRYAGKTVLAIGAHPDSIPIGVGGALARLRAAGARVVAGVVCAPELRELRLAEARAAAAILGAEHRVLVGGRSCRVEDLKGYDLVEGILEWIEELEPAAVFSHGRAEVHMDHRLVYEACLGTLRERAADFFCFFPPSPRPIPVDFRPRAFVDITGYFETKRRAVLAHASRRGRLAPMEIIEGWAREHGRMMGTRHGEGLEVERLIF